MHTTGGIARGRIKRMSVVVYPTLGGETDRFKALYQQLDALSRASALEDIYHAALASLLEATAADRAAILLFDIDGVIRFKAARGLSEAYQAAATGYSPWPRRTPRPQPLVVPDALLDQSLAPFQEALRQEGIASVAFLPLALDAGVFGQCIVYYAEPHECTADELEMANAIAAHLALAIERKRAEMECVRSEQLLQAIVDNSATILYIKDPEGRYLLVNRQFENRFHVTRAAVVGRTDYDLFPRELADEFRANDEAVLSAGKAVSIEECAPENNEMHSYVWVKSPLAGPDGSTAAIWGIATDVTERQQLEAASLRLAAIVESSDDAIISKDLNGIVTSWNQGAERIFGYTAAEMVGKPLSILMAPDRLDEMPRILDKIRGGDRVRHYETRRRRKDGLLIDVALTVSPVRNAAGRIVGASKIARDITDHKQAEKQRAVLMAREQEARRTAELLNRVAPRLAAQLDLEKLVQEVTEIATTLVGAERSAFFRTGADQKVPAQDALHHFHLPGHQELIDRTLRGEDIVRRADVTEDPGHSAIPEEDSEGLPAIRSYLSAPVIARSGEILGGLFFGHSAPDQFTEVHEAIVAGIAAQAAIAMDNANLFERAQWVQAELRRSNEELRRVNHDLEVFAYSASHDLQEPLRTISISAQILERNWGQHLESDDTLFLKNILNASSRMVVLIEDLLAYTRATKYEEGPAPQVDSARVLTNVLESMQGTIVESGAIVTAGELPVISFHESRLAQLFQNLIGNAIKYRSKEVPHVHITAAARDGWCVFSVVDNGIGIDSQYAERIFGLFKRLHSREEYPGSGIGLAICQRVVEQYGGRIWLERSTPGGGSTFSFSLPAGRR